MKWPRHRSGAPDRSSCRMFSRLRRILIVSLLATHTKAQDICTCSPREYGITLDLSGTCQNVGGFGDGVLLTDCSVIPFDNASVTDLIPVSVTLIDVSELGQNLLTVLGRERFQGNFESGVVVRYSSITSTEEPLKDIPKAFSISMIGVNLAGEQIVFSGLVAFSNACDDYPYFLPGSTNGWAKLAELQSPDAEACPAVPKANPTPGPVGSPSAIPDVNPTAMPIIETTPQPTIFPMDQPVSILPVVITTTLPSASSPTETPFTRFPSNMPTRQPQQSVATPLPTDIPFLSFPSVPPSDYDETNYPTAFRQAPPTEFCDAELKVTNNRRELIISTLFTQGKSKSKSKSRGKGSFTKSSKSKTKSSKSSKSKGKGGTDGKKKNDRVDEIENRPIDYEMIFDEIFRDRENEYRVEDCPGYVPESSSSKSSKSYSGGKGYYLGFTDFPTLSPNALLPHTPQPTRTINPTESTSFEPSPRPSMIPSIMPKSSPSGFPSSEVLFTTLDPTDSNVTTETNSTNEGFPDDLETQLVRSEPGPNTVILRGIAISLVSLLLVLSGILCYKQSQRLEERLEAFKRSCVSGDESTGNMSPCEGVTGTVAHNLVEMSVSVPLDVANIGHHEDEIMNWQDTELKDSVSDLYSEDTAFR